MYFGTYFISYLFSTKLHDKAFRLLSKKEVKISLPKIICIEHVVFHFVTAKV
jgi:hypothetical protein